MIKWIKSWFCDHDYQWFRNIYGDEINALNGKRSVWVCPKCGNVQLRADLGKG